MTLHLRKFWATNKSLFLFLLLMFCFRSAIADWNVVPTGSMKPTIIEGDRILVNKIAYDLHLPFTHISVVKRGDPIRGDIIIFDSKAADKRLVKRVVGVPGDTLSMRNNVLTLNGKVLAYSSLDRQDSYENLDGVEHMIRTRPKSRYANFGPIKVPKAQYLVLGDNRDSSADSRVIGLVPRSEVIGRSRQVVMSLDYDNYYLPRQTRFIKTL